MKNIIGVVIGAAMTLSGIAMATKYAKAYFTGLKK